MEALILRSQKRDVTGKQVERLRSAGLIPAVVYGHGFDSRNLSIEYRNFEKIFAAAGESSLVDLAVGDDTPVKVLIQSVQRDPLLGRVTHVDFRQVKMTEKLEAEIMLRFVGEAPAVKELGGVLVRNLDSIKVRCLPQHLVHEIDVDMMKLKKFDDSFKVRDLVVPEGIEFLNKPNDLIVVVNEPISEAELAALDAKPEADVSQVKVAGEENKKETEKEGKE